MIGNIVKNMSYNYYIILDKIRIKDKDFYLVKDYKTQDVTKLDPMDIIEIITKNDYYITKYNIVSNSIEKLMQILEVNQIGTILMTEKVKEKLEMNYGFRIKNLNVNESYDLIDLNSMIYDSFHGI